MKQYASDVRRRLVPMAIAVVVFAVAFPVALLFIHASASTPSPHDQPACDARCHAAGLAQIQEAIDAKVTALTRGHQCYPVDPSRLTKYVVVRALTSATVTKVTFDRAWALNHDATPLNDVWVEARCN